MVQAGYFWILPCWHPGYNTDCSVTSRRVSQPQQRDESKTKLTRQSQVVDFPLPDAGQQI